MERILDNRVLNKIRGYEYYEYLIKWRDHALDDDNWVTATLIHKSGSIIEEIMNRSS